MHSWNDDTTNQGTKELFEQQLQGWAGPCSLKIRSRGYWDIRIRPVTFQPELLLLSELRQLFIRASLNYQGWEFLYIAPKWPDTGLD